MPGWGRSTKRRKSCIPGALTGFVGRQQRFQGPLPAWTQRRDASGMLEPITRRRRKVEQRTDFGHGDALRPVGDLLDGVACADLAFLNDAQVKARSPLRNQHGRHPGVLHPDADSIARDARLSYLEDGAADPVPITDAYLVIGQPDRKSKRLNSSHANNSYAVFCLKKKIYIF